MQLNSNRYREIDCSVIEGEILSHSCAAIIVDCCVRSEFYFVSYYKVQAVARLLYCINN